MAVPPRLAEVPSASNLNASASNLFQIAVGAPMLPPVSPLHRVHAGDPKISLDPTPGRPEDEPQTQLCMRCGSRVNCKEMKFHVQNCLSTPKASSRQQQRYTYPSRPVPIPGLPTCEICNESLRLEPGAHDDLEDPYYMDGCEHVFCKKCLKEHVKQQAARGGTTMGSVCCPAECTANITAYDLLNFLSREEYDALLASEITQFVEESNGAFVNCPHCEMLFERLAGTANCSKVFAKEIGGRILSQKYYEHYVHHRLRCPSCDTEFCGSCCVTPYHLGNTCVEYQDLSEATLCRFCDRAVATPPDFMVSPRKRKPQICDSVECEAYQTDACSKTLPCGHPCPGIANEQTCPPCFIKNCPTNPAKDGSAWCSICYVGELRSAPCTVLKCGHIFHYKCVTKQLLQKWPGARISFGFMSCPECSAEISHPGLVDILKDLVAFRCEVRNGASLRLSHEGLDKDPAVSSPEGVFYENAPGYAEAILSYYQCYVCERPYFGGIKRCEDIQDDQGKYNPSELVCATCVPFRELKSCRIHGSEFIEYKCKFCCSVAQWFCWGTTHFCISCHRMQERGEFVTKKKIAELPSCEGRHTCNLRVDHPPNGTEEFALGCAVCRVSNTTF
eukprot:TRINITY_DN6729_c0_g1_i1.p1 TRINITY_DN6729_c0_g1~~TRINITY_DN6729_c0_g1_i1.p1  ORF type:complete len:617 (+),score=49.20 TRINITY_DN6729_c0_g1_i1:107-1957(+)